ncbi:L-lactate permease, partial [Ramlibacter sp.]|uniref:L-lactate permease n=1 Tax=Ramlibacter sp. TaxID=1917967 RepID=UPI001823CE1C
RPFEGSPAWSPLLHPATWLVVVGVATAIVSRRARAVLPSAQRAWANGSKAVLTIGLFLVAAMVLADAGIAAALAQGLQQALGPFAVIATPLLAGTFGAVTGSSNATNGLLMASQVALAADGRIPLAWIAALQNSAAAALTMLSPARVATGCALAGQRDLEREVYRRAWPLGAAALAVLVACAVGLLLATAMLRP